MAWLVLAFLFMAGGAGAAQQRFGNPDFLIKNWLEDDGLPESAVYALAQTPDGYIWVGTAYGVVRYNGIEFEPSGRGGESPILNGGIQYLYADHEGRLWASGDQGLAIREDGNWRTLRLPNMVARTMAEDTAGHFLLGTYDGRLFSIRNGQIRPAQAPHGLAPSGVFCLADKHDGGLWLANRGFIGRFTPQGWKRYGPPALIHGSLVATAARGGGIWIYVPGKLTKFERDGTKREFPAPDLDQPRLLLEDRSGAIWIASSTRGYVRLIPGGPVLATANATNGLVHNSAWCLLQDVEGNFWLGSSSGGLCRLQPKVFHVVTVENGLPSQIVRTVAEESPGHIIIGTAGRGSVRLEDGKVIPVRPTATNGAQDNVWSILHDHAGRTWTGTYGGGLWVEQNGVTRNFPLPARLGKTIPCLMEDSHQRIWVGTGSGLGMIDQDEVVDCSANTPMAGGTVWCLAEDPHSGAIWIGTYDRGLFRLANKKFAHYGRNQGLPSNRIGSLLLDHDDNLWIGLYDKGLACLHGDQIGLVGENQGFPAATAGSMLEDGLGWIWFGTDRGILRASEAQLQKVARGEQKAANFVLFDASDGLYSADSSAGFQPAALRDHAGRLWFATMNGVVTVDPLQIHLNTNRPPVVLEQVTYIDGDGRFHDLYTPGAKPLSLPRGSTDLHFYFAALSFSAPEKNRYAVRVEGFDDKWKTPENHHSFIIHVVPPGVYRLQIKASNNDDTWNEEGAVLPFTVGPYFWQTVWFRLMVLLGVAAAGGLAAWRLTLIRVQQQITLLEQQRALEHERARLATVMEATSDLVAFANSQGGLLHLNPAGRRLLGLDAASDISGLTLAQLHPAPTAARLAEMGIPTARAKGIWEGETLLRHRDGHEIPVIQTIMAHQGQKDGDSFLSTIARDITAQKQAEQASERLQAQLLQAQKMESVGRLAGGIAHDFNNMLQVIIGNTDLALEAAPRGGELHSELLEIQKSANRSAELTSQLLTFARKQVFRAQELNLQETVAGTSKMLQRLIGENIQLVLNASADLWRVRMDPSQVTQILTNLAINARDAIHGQGRLVVQLSNVILPRDAMPVDESVVPGEYVRLSVQDNGQGMSREILEHLFEPFFTTKEVGKGTGLGLATVFGIVKQNNGLIQVDSTPRVGTTFRIYFPRSVSTLMNNLPPAHTRKPTDGSETILIVEDEENILQLIVLTLRKHGYKVIAAPVPEMALIMAASHPGKIDLLVTDIVMPGMNGKQLQEKLSALQPQMKSLFMSGYTAEIIAQHGDLEPGLNFLQKPFTIQNFLEKVRKTLEAQPGPGPG